MSLETRAELVLLGEEFLPRNVEGMIRWRAMGARGRGAACTDRVFFLSVQVLLLYSVLPRVWSCLAIFPRVGPSGLACRGDA